jgi:23S rRNA G2069 N7-methylase RlmK/C1962 C5-methylase RlmI
MNEILDIERDHAKLIQQSMALLEKDGMLIFSTNKKGLKLDADISKRYQVKDITAQTIPEDFKRRPRIHQCWEITF